MNNKVVQIFREVREYPTCPSCEEEIKEVYVDLNGRSRHLSCDGVISDPPKSGPIEEDRDKTNNGISKENERPRLEASILRAAVQIASILRIEEDPAMKSQMAAAMSLLAIAPSLGMTEQARLIFMAKRLANV